jgi:hypothetical protein
MSPQQVFADALLDGSAACPPGLVAWNGSDPARRFAVYRNNVMISLIDALEDGFPVTRALVGEDFFRGMARLFASAHPPRSRILAFYGEEFPAFVENFPPAAAVPYLADVARLELLRTLAYHAADARPLTTEQIGAALNGNSVAPDLRFALHPSVAILRSRFAVVSLWAAHQGLADMETVDPGIPQAALVVRVGLDVNVVGIEAAAGRFIEQLRGNATLADAAATTAAEFAEFDLAASLAVLMRWQTLCALVPDSGGTYPGGMK